MAKPIEPTPVLKGKDAERFLKSIKESKYSESKDRFLKECDQTYKVLSKKAK